MLVRGRKNIIIFAVFIFLFAILSIVTGLYFRKLSKPSNIIERVFNTIKDKEYHYLFPNKDVYVGDTFTLESSLDFELDSELYKNKSVEDIDYLKKYNFIKNLSLLDTKFVIKHDAKNRRLLQTLDQTIGQEDIYHKKVYIDNETEYYYVGDILNQYVNNGNCNYFETIRENSNIIDNFQYLYQHFFVALNNSLNTNDIKEYETNENIGGVNKKVHQVSIRFDDRAVKSIWNSVIKEYENDKEAGFLLRNMFPNYKDYFVNEEDSLLQNNEYYDLNIYTTRILYKPLKFELIHMNGNDKETYIYEGDMSTGTGYYIINDQVQNTVDVSWKDQTIIFKIKNFKGEDVGSFSFDRDGNNITASYTYEDNNKKYDVSYSSKYDKVSKGKSFTNTKQLSFKFIEDNIVHLNGNVIFNRKQNNKVMIEETLGEPILVSKLNDEVKELFRTKNDRVRERLEK